MTLGTILKKYKEIFGPFADASFEARKKGIMEALKLLVSLRADVSLEGATFIPLEGQLPTSGAIADDLLEGPGMDEEVFMGGWTAKP